MLVEDTKKYNFEEMLEQALKMENGGIENFDSGMMQKKPEAAVAEGKKRVPRKNE